MHKKLIIFDMDGTIYLGKNLIDGAKETFEFLNDNHIEYVFFTNNSSHDLEFYYDKMKAFGIKCDLKHNFYSSTEVTISYLLDKGIKDIYVIGNKCLKDKLVKHFNIVKEYSKDNKVDAVVCGFSTELVYQELKDASLYLQTQDIPFIATNGDYRCPIEDGLYIPDCGGMCEWLTHTSGKKATVLGKPNPEIVYYLSKKFNVSLDDILVVGDRLYTDILVGVNANVDTLCVLSGESSQKDIDSYPHKPTFIKPSIKSLIDLLK
ncbi:MAG TPA: HAD-IIA family hydrolase [Bacilli bacterium]|nr:HAD-IIA family hydrolase [Bacilli bacterium]HQA55470.1 HAD-IIA family hydrolase [Bacilli bacterium]